MTVRRTVELVGLMVYGRECGDCETHCRVGLMVYGRECGDCETH